MGGVVPSPPRPLRSRTRQLDRDIDLLDVAGDEGIVWERDGHGLAARGVAARIPISTLDPGAAADAVAGVLGAIESLDEVEVPGSGPVALGALPFAPHTVGELVVPRLVVGRASGGRQWITTIGDDPPTLEPLPISEPAAGHFSVVAERDPEDWCVAVAAARDELLATGRRKVVLARAVRVAGDRPLSPTRLLRRLREGYGTCMLYAVDGFVGASPELLVSRIGDAVRAHPMAGTAPRSADPTQDARLAAGLLASHKDREEHQITIDFVHDTLLPWCSYLDWEPEPRIVAMPNVQHLATRMEGRLSGPAASAVELMAALHPTPAVCGDPVPDALEMIGRLEGLDRGRYAGPVGWVDSSGNGEWAVGIRCAELAGPAARVFAGVGVVAESDPHAELAETEVKLEAVLSALVRP